MPGIDAQRGEIDRIDDEILALFKRRMALAEEIVQYKIENKLPVFDPQRERGILHRACSACEGRMQHYAKMLFATLFDISRTHQDALINKGAPAVDEIRRALAAAPAEFPMAAVVACQGVEGAYSQIAAGRVFQAPKIEYMQTFDGVFNAVDKGLCAYGMLPVENSTAGSVTAVYELMGKYRFHIARSVKMRVSHSLLAPEGAALKDITEVFSHGQAIGQCGGFFKTNPRIKATVCENTAVAAMTVARSGRKDAAALSSKNCAALYGLSLLAEDVQDGDNNYTRFICISKDLQIHKGAGKISLMASLENKAGALHALLTKFSTLGLNLTKLESRPVKGTDFEFMFYFDIDGGVEDEKALDLIGLLSRTTDHFAFLGNYSEV